MATNLESVKKLREMTGAGMMDAKKALDEARGDIEAAVDNLRKAGMSKAAKKSERVARQGLVESYVHAGKIGTLVELNCETDFVARTDDFKQLARDLAMQVAAAQPAYIRPEDVPVEAVAKEKEIYRAEVDRENKPTDVADKIVAGKLDKYFESVCLLKQPYIKDPSRRVEDLVTEQIAKLGENIVVRQIARIELGVGHG